MTVRDAVWGVGGFGVLVAIVLAAGGDTVGGAMALIQLCFLVGLPLALILRHDLRSWRVTAVIAAAVSVALTAISVQFLVWFEVAHGPLIVLLATAYGVTIALLLESGSSGRGGTDLARRIPRSIGPSRSGDDGFPDEGGPDGDGVPDDAEPWEARP